MPTFQYMIDSFKIGDIVNDNMDTIDESRSVINTNNNDAIKKIFKNDEND